MTKQIREPLTEMEIALVDKFEHIVKEEIDKIDPIGLLKLGAPPNEYAAEIRGITLRIRQTSSWLWLSEIMYIVFSYNFDMEDAGPQTKYMEAAKRISDKIYGDRK